MRHSFFILILFPVIGFAQTSNHLNDLVVKDSTANFNSIPLGSDSLSSAFLIVIKNEVKSHKHVYHTENVYIIEGTGHMTMGDKEFDVKPGDHFFIPKGIYHGVKVTSTKPLKLLSVQSPYSDGTDRVFE